MEERVNKLCFLANVMIMAYLSHPLLLNVINVEYLLQCGFFKRKKHEQEKLMQHQAEVQKMIPADANGAEKG